jgi:hypothetical protein
MILFADACAILEKVKDSEAVGAVVPQKNERIE